jgi:hypothetical protein
MINDDIFSRKQTKIMHREVNIMLRESACRFCHSPQNLADSVTHPTESGGIADSVTKLKNLADISDFLYLLMKHLNICVIIIQIVRIVLSSNTTSETKIQSEVYNKLLRLPIHTYIYTYSRHEDQ